MSPSPQAPLAPVASPPPPPLVKTTKILIVGAGIFGLSTALHLLERGYSDVTVLDRAGEVPAVDAASTDINKGVCFRSCGLGFRGVLLVWARDGGRVRDLEVWGREILGYLGGGLGGWDYGPRGRTQIGPEAKRADVVLLPFQWLGHATATSSTLDLQERLC
jgi:hypothetical protein